MSLASDLEAFFRSDVRNAGRRFFETEKVSASRPAELEVQAYVRGSTVFRVVLRTDSFESTAISADCTCPDSRKGRLCKHIWAVLLKTDEKLSDFLEAKTEIHKAAANSPAEPVAPNRGPSGARVVAQESARRKQAEYRRERYEKQKERAQELRSARKKASRSKPGPTLSAEVERALNYFAANGFDLGRSPDPSELALAKKQLSRVFHPDKGGSHDEILELNGHHDVLAEFSRG